MPPDNDVLRGLLSDSKKLFGIASSSATIDLQRMAPALAAELIALRERLADPDVVLYCAYLAKSRALAAEVAPIQAAFEAGDESQREPFLAKLEEFLLVESLENERRAKGILLTQIAESQLSMLKMLEAMSRKDEQLAERLATVEGERDEARRELAELKAKTAHLHAVLEAPENAGKPVSELYVELRGKL